MREFVGPPVPDEWLARRWLPYCLRWAEQAARRHGDPLGLYCNAAVDGLLTAIRLNDRPGSKFSIELLKACLLSAGRNATKTHRRRSARHPSVTIGEGDRLATDTGQDQIDGRDLWHTRRARLTDYQARVIELTVWQGLSDSAAAGLLNTTANAVCVARRRAIAQLRDTG